MNGKLSDIYWPLRLAYGLVPLLAGLDKYVGLLADWKRYMSPLALEVLPVPVETFLHMVGVVEMIVGLIVLLGLTRLGAVIAAVWLVVISLQLLLAGYFDIAVRDLVMAIGAYSLMRIAAERGEEFVPNLLGSAEPLAHR